MVLLEANYKLHGAIAPYFHHKHMTSSYNYRSAQTHTDLTLELLIVPVACGMVGETSTLTHCRVISWHFLRVPARSS